MSCIQPASAPELAIQPTSVCGSVLRCMVLFASASVSVCLLSLFASIDFDDRKPSFTSETVNTAEKPNDIESFGSFRTRPASRRLTSCGVVRERETG